MRLPLLPLAMLSVWIALGLTANSALFELEIAGPMGPPFNISTPTLFGYSLALMPDGAHTVVVGATPTDPNALGRAYILEQNNVTLGWDLTVTLSPPVNSLGGEGSFGSKVAIAVGAVVISSSHAVTPTSNIGAVYIYRPTAQGWESLPSSVLVSPIPSVGCTFGSSIALLGEYLLIACGTSQPKLGPVTSYAVLYILDDLTTPVATYTPSLPTDYAFGYEVALSDSFAFVASWGRIDIFDRQNSSNVWNMTSTGYVPYSPPVARGNELLVNWASRATLYRYIIATNEWQEEANFTFGFLSSVALTDSYIYLGSGTKSGLTYGTGAVAVHNRTTVGGWSEKPIRVIAATNGKQTGYFGAEVHLSNNGSVLVGSFGTSSFGSLYVYWPTNACGGALIDQVLNQNAICNGTTLFYFDPLIIDIPTVIATPIISIEDIYINGSSITIIGGNYPFQTQACVSIDNTTLSILLNYSPRNDMLYLTNTLCVNGSFSAISIESRDCQQYTAGEQVQTQEGFAVLLDTDRSGCQTLNLPAIIAGSIAGGLLLVTLLALGLIACYAPHWLRCVTAPRRREQHKPAGPEVYQT